MCARERRNGEWEYDGMGMRQCGSLVLTGCSEALVTACGLRVDCWRQRWGGRKRERGRGGRRGEKSLRTDLCVMTQCIREGVNRREREKR